MGNVEEKEQFIGELKGRLISQMKLIDCLKENLIATKARESDLQKEKELLEFRIREINQELTLSKTLNKPVSCVQDLGQNV